MKDERSREWVYKNAFSFNTEVTELYLAEV